jgi:hypothetical protein
LLRNGWPTLLRNGWPTLVRIIQNRLHMPYSAIRISNIWKLNCIRVFLVLCEYSIRSLLVLEFLMYLFLILNLFLT